jgi:hypothetical protein
VSTGGRFFVFEMQDEELKKLINFQLTTNQEARVMGNDVEIDLFRGSSIRRNRAKMASLRFPKAQIIDAIITDTFFDLISSEEAKLNLPLVPDEYGWQ